MKIHRFFTVFFFLTGLITQVFGQEGRNSEIIINASIVNENNEPIGNAKVVLGDGNIISFTDKAGRFALEAKSDNILIIKALGYKEKTIDLAENGAPEEIILERMPYFKSKQYEIELPSTITTYKREFVGAVDKISGKELESQPDIVFSNVLQGRLSGLTARMTTSGLGNNNALLYVRGLAREGANQAITVVDGVERPIDFLYAQEIESIEVLKDANAKILYGPRAANGVILITTKKGKDNTQVFNVSAEYGVAMNTRMAEYLNSAQYARLYNEARINDGFSPLYTDADIQGYEQSTGANDLYYPDVDYNDYFINNTNPFRKANIEYSGGEEGINYALLAGYIGTQGIEKIGRPVKQDRINVRGNLKIDITSFLSANVGANGIIESRNWGKLDQDEVFNAIRTQRPNEFPFVIMDPNFQGEETPLGEEQIPPLGGSIQNPGSLYGNLVYGGYQEYQFFYGQTNFGLDLKLDNFIKGLSASSYLTFDNYQYHSANQFNNPIRYARQIVLGSDGQDSLAYKKLNNRVIAGNRSESGNNIERNLGWTSKLDYKRTFNEVHQLSATLSHFYYINDKRGNRQKDENTNTFLRTSYGYKDKVYLDWTQSVMGSNRFSVKNRYKYFSSFGAAYVLSEERFLKNNTVLNYFKIKGSYGMLGYDRATNFYLYETRYFDSGQAQFGERNQGGAPRTGYSNFGNPDLRWETSHELNLGIEGMAFNESLMFEFNYFNEIRDDIIYDNPFSIYSPTFGNQYIPQNLGKIENNGVDGKVSYSGGAGDFRYTIGTNFLYVKNKVIEANAIHNPEGYRDVRGKSSDVIFGYVSKGLFKDKNQVSSAPFQTLGEYGVGNIQYEDLDGDGVITEQDQKVIGNNFPRTSFGVSLNINYKGFGLSVLGTSELGVDYIKNSTYYRNSGEGKYSVIALDRFHPVNNPNGSQPALTTKYPSNDYQASTFWIQDASFFRLKNAEISYTFSKDTRIAKIIRLYLRGTNLFVLSNVKDLDPEVPDSGVNNYPLFRTLTGGLTVGF